MTDTAILWTSDNEIWTIVRNCNGLVRIYRRGDKKPIQTTAWKSVPAYVRFAWDYFRAINEPEPKEQTVTLIDKGAGESTQLANIWVTLESAHSALDTYDDGYDDVEARELMWHISEYMDSASRRLAATIAQSKGHPTHD